MATWFYPHLRLHVNDLARNKRQKFSLLLFKFDNASQNYSRATQSGLSVDRFRQRSTIFDPRPVVPYNHAVIFSHPQLLRRRFALNRLFWSVADAVTSQLQRL